MRLSSLQRKHVIAVLAPILLSPIVILTGNSTEGRCVFGICLMSTYWTAEVVSIGMTSLLPLFLFPVMGLLDGKDIGHNYMKDSVVLFIVTLFMALAVEETGLHRRIALKLLTKVGTRPLSLLSGVMCVTCFISFFVSDTACTALMLPIAVALLTTMHSARDGEQGVHEDDPVESLRKSLKGMNDVDRGFCKALVLATTHASLIGGTAIVTSTGPNIVFRDLLHKAYGGRIEMTYLQWMTFAMPPLPFYLVCSYIVIVCYFMGPSSFVSLYRSSSEEDKQREKAVAECVQKQYKAMGDVTFAEKSVCGWFAVILTLWISRSPGFVTGWGDILPKEMRLTDSSVGVLVVFLLFLWPKEHMWQCGSVAHDKLPPDSVPTKKPSPPTILSWPAIQRRFSWSVVLLIGAGYAMSDAVQHSGLARWVSCHLGALIEPLPMLVIQLCISCVILTMTEFTSNAATASIFMPIVFGFAHQFHVHPLYLGIPAVTACSFAFMLPMATPANAIVFGTRIVSMREMVLTGLLLNLLCILVTVANMNTWTWWIFSLGDVPENLPVTWNNTC